MIGGAVRVNQRVEIAIRTPAIAYDNRAGFDPVTYDARQHVGSSVQYGNKECSAGPSFNNAKHLLNLNRVPCIILPPTELALVNFNGLIRTTNLFGASLQERQHSFPAQHAPDNDRMVTKAKIVSDLVGRLAAHDVCYE